MEIEDMNAKAREAFGKHLLDISLAINKGIMLLMTIVPLGMTAKSIFGGEAVDFMIVLKKMGSPIWYVFLALLCLSFVLSFIFREQGLKHIHESSKLKARCR